jgi:PhnB protein
VAVKPIPEGYRAITPVASFKDAAKAIDYFKKVFGAEERMRMAGPGGEVVHCEMVIRDSVFMFGEAGPDGPQPMRVALYVTDCDAVFKRAVDAGAKVKEPLANQFYGDRSGRVIDPFGNEWSIMTHVEDVSREEMDRRMKKLYGG